MSYLVIRIDSFLKKLIKNLEKLTFFINFKVNLLDVELIIFYFYKISLIIMILIITKNIVFILNL